MTRVLCSETTLSTYKLLKIFSRELQGNATVNCRTNFANHSDKPPKYLNILQETGHTEKMYSKYYFTGIPKLRHGK